MEFTLADLSGHTARVTIRPHEVTFKLDAFGDPEEIEITNQYDGPINYLALYSLFDIISNQHAVEVSFPAAVLLDKISNLKPNEVAYIAIFGDTMVTMRRHTPEDGDFDYETVELQVGSPECDGASLCLPMTTFRALLTTHAVVP